MRRGEGRRHMVILQKGWTRPNLLRGKGEIRVELLGGPEVLS